MMVESRPQLSVWLCYTPDKSLSAPLTRKWFSGRSCIRSNWNWKCWFLRRGENRRTRRKTSRSRVKNQQPTYPTNTSHVGGRRVQLPLRHPCYPKAGQNTQMNSAIQPFNNWGPKFTRVNIKLPYLVTLKILSKRMHRRTLIPIGRWLIASTMASSSKLLTTTWQQSIQHVTKNKTKNRSLKGHVLTGNECYIINPFPSKEFPTDE